MGRKDGFYFTEEEIVRFMSKEKLKPTFLALALPSDRRQDTSGILMTCAGDDCFSGEQWSLVSTTFRNLRGH